ncbi:MAG: hypothetical protein Q9170_005936 [Blastenia crenularia]
MFFLRILIGALLAFVASGYPQDTAVSNASPVSSTPKLVRLFTATIHLGDDLPPIPIPAGQRIVANVKSGQLSGSGFSGTISGGVSIIDIVNNGQNILNNVRSYGTTSDGLPFLIDESGLGSSADDFARLIFSVGGKYANLTNQFIVTEATLSSDRKTVSTAAYVTQDR